MAAGNCPHTGFVLAVLIIALWPTGLPAVNAEIQRTTEERNTAADHTTTNEQQTTVTQTAPSQQKTSEQRQMARYSSLGHNNTVQLSLVRRRVLPDVGGETNDNAEQNSTTAEGVSRKIAEGKQLIHIKSANIMSEVDGVGVAEPNVKLADKRTTKKIDSNGLDGKEAGRTDPPPYHEKEIGENPREAGNDDDEEEEKKTANGWSKKQSDSGVSSRTLTLYILGGLLVCLVIAFVSLPFACRSRKRDKNHESGVVHVMVTGPSEASIRSLLSLRSQRSHESSTATILA